MAEKDETQKKLSETVARLTKKLIRGPDDEGSTVIRVERSKITVERPKTTAEIKAEAARIAQKLKTTSRQSGAEIVPKRWTTNVDLDTKTRIQKAFASASADVKRVLGGPDDYQANSVVIGVVLEIVTSSTELQNDPDFLLSKAAEVMYSLGDSSKEAHQESILLRYRLAERIKELTEGRSDQGAYEAAINQHVVFKNEGAAQSTEKLNVGLPGDSKDNEEGGLHAASGSSGGGEQPPPRKPPDLPPQEPPDDFENSEELPRRVWALYDKDVDDPVSFELLEALTFHENTLRALNPTPEQEIDALNRIAVKLAEGKFETIREEITKDGGIKTVRDTIQFDRHEALKYIERIQSRIRELNQQRVEVREAGIAGLNINAADTLGEVVEKSMRYAGSREEVYAAYSKLSPEEQEKFINEMKRRIRLRIQLLEDNPEPWRIGGIEPLQMELQTWFSLMQGINQHEYEKMHIEAEARSWLHLIYNHLKKGASPFDDKAILGANQEMDDIRYFDSISRLPGVNEAFKLLDSNYEQILAAETNPGEKERIMKKIINHVEELGICKTSETGITAEAAVRLAERHFLQTGRDATWYRFYIRKNKLVKFDDVIDSKTGEKITKVSIDPRTPLLWNQYRLLYCPEALWVFFQFGANREGEIHEITVGTNPDGSPKKLEARLAQGVGADVLKTMMNSGFDVCLQDFYSRRKDYILSAIIEQNLDGALIASMSDGAEKTKLLKDREIWIRQINKLNEPDRTVAQLQREVLEADMGVSFAEKFGTQAWKLPDEKKYQDFISRIDKAHVAAGNNRDLVTALEDTRSRLEVAYEKAKEINGEIERKYGKDYGGFFPSMANYDIAEVPHERISRLQENVRGNARDHVSGLQVLQRVGDFINDPTLPSLFKLDPGLMKAYTAYSSGQKHLVQPAYQAFVEVQRGRGLFGYEHFGFIDRFKSKLSRVRDTQSLNDLDIYKAGRMLVNSGWLSRDQFYQLRGGKLGLMRDKVLEYADPVSLVILGASVAQEQLKQIQKDLEKA